MTRFQMTPRHHAFSPHAGAGDAADNAAREADWQPSVDIVEHHDRFVMSADLPGVAPDDIDIRMQENVLTLAGERAPADPGVASLRNERRSGRFLRRFTLPASVNGDRIEAHSRHGNLEIVIPKVTRPAARRIDVDAA